MSPGHSAEYGHVMPDYPSGPLPIGPVDRRPVVPVVPVVPDSPPGPAVARPAAPQAGEVARTPPRHVPSPGPDAGPYVQPADGPDSQPEPVRPRSWFEALPRPQEPPVPPPDARIGQPSPSGPVAGPPPEPPARSADRPAPPAESAQPAAPASPFLPPAADLPVSNGTSPRRIDQPSPQPASSAGPESGYGQAPGHPAQPETSRPDSEAPRPSVTTGREASDDTCPLPVILPGHAAPAAVDRDAAPAWPAEPPPMPAGAPAPAPDIPSPAPPTAPAVRDSGLESAPRP